MSTWALVAAGAAALFWLVARRIPLRVTAVLLPFSAVVFFVAAWQISCDLTDYDLRTKDGGVRRIHIFPAPWATLMAMIEPLSDGTILRFSVASLFRVACGFGLAVVIGIPLGLVAGWSTRTFQGLNPLVQALRPISPIAWIPLAILWFGVKDASAIFIVFLATFFPIVTGTVAAVRSTPLAYLRAARNFGIDGIALFRRVLFPAALPQIVTSLRLALGIAWMVIVAAEMIAVDAGLGYLITDARNANNYERVIGAMVCIGLIGFGLDVCMRRVERLDEVRWGFPAA